VSTLEESIRLDIDAKEAAPLSDFQRVVHAADFLSIACLADALIALDASRMAPTKKGFQFAGSPS